MVKVSRLDFLLFKTFIRLTRNHFAGLQKKEMHAQSKTPNKKKVKMSIELLAY